MPEQKPSRCPFCGSRDVTVWQQHDKRRSWSIKCVNGCTVSINNYNSRDGALEAWNRRPHLEVFPFVQDDAAVVEYALRLAFGKLLDDACTASRFGEKPEVIADLDRQYERVLDVYRRLIGKEPTAGNGDSRQS